jgi:hypothetical protein
MGRNDWFDDPFAHSRLHRSRNTDPKLIKAFKMLENKVANLPKKKHGNIPL